MDVFGLYDEFAPEDKFKLDNRGTGKYLIYMSDAQYAPPINRDDKTGSWIGYRFMDKQRYARAWQEQIGPHIYQCVPLRFTLRLAFVGKQAEELADTTFTWEDRDDVKRAFESRGFQVAYSNRELYTYAVKQEGFNDIISWITDVSGMGVIKIDTNIRPWYTR